MVVAVTAVLVYTLVAVLYGLSGRVQTTGETHTPPPGALTIVLTPQTVNAAGESITMTLEIEPSDALMSAGGLALSDDITVLVSPVLASQSIDFPAGKIPQTQTIVVQTPGMIENWPADTYQTQMLVTATRTVNGAAVPLSPAVIFDGQVPGWTLTGVTQNLHAEQSATALALGAVSDGSGSLTLPVLELTAKRSWSTFAFGVLLLGLMIAIAVLVLLVAITVYRGRRKVEPSFMSWIGAMLFATIPLRSFLPGAPPIGSWIDYLVVLWVMIALVVGLVVYAAGWARWGSPSIPVTQVSEPRKGDAGQGL
ncbi:DUF4436 family protein [Subtercola boreus]|uniref:DUF4436 domain-containing protein n=1 Tax=Subtercola boreus TaxID=120213 RepID=A0A3E0WCS5_9MICO|nr:DUF4436 family protein [Subtercola boreus]RFA18726.1 hypothetical protein B7R23_14065 [Subtercola boreus]RFA22346.1 hypothetical protein B7R24_04630 [Subtercola boreus]RFA28322.1 hypothetical protein B7R25_04700 [Subtercola boreus]